MTNNANNGDFSELLASAGKLLHSFTAMPAAATADLRAEGESPDGLVRAAVLTGGQVASVTIDPRAMRLDSQTLGENVTAAVNAALVNLRARATEATPATDLDVETLGAELRAVQDSSVRQMNSFLQAITAAQERVAGSR